MADILEPPDTEDVGPAKHPAGICPFQSYVIADDEYKNARFVQVECPRDKGCQLWDDGYDDDGVQYRYPRCGANTIRSLDLIHRKANYIYKYQKHKHNMHIHSNPHDCEFDHNDLSFDMGKAAAPSELSCSAQLQQEFTSGVDIDQNGSVFGKDFVIDPTDKDCPKSILDLYSQPDFAHETFSQMKWADYLATLSFIGR